MKQTFYIKFNYFSIMLDSDQQKYYNIKKCKYLNLFSFGFPNVAVWKVIIVKKPQESYYTKKYIVQGKLKMK